ncbi:hypothetical protein HY612_04195 [Candidatus Roizmanbacteria bacterium]|nr:hypothetical protein [Candidatus Roizmanbacteria bacterium]
MKYLDLRAKIKTNLFTFNDVSKYFAGEDRSLLKTQLSRFINKNLIGQLKKGYYYFEKSEIDPYEVASWLYQPSYISLETALFYYGVIPDVPQNITSVSPTTTKKLVTPVGIYAYAKISPKLFFGYRWVSTTKEKNFSLAKKEKALLDFFYIRRIKDSTELRLNLNEFDKRLFQTYVKSYPRWVAQISLDEHFN